MTPPARRTLVSFAAVVFLYSLTQITLAGVDPGSLPVEYLELVSIGSIGVTPWLSAYILVELVAAIVPRWQALRDGSLEGRATIERTVRVVGIGFAVVQSFAFAVSLEQMSFGLTPLVHEPGLSFRLGVMLTLTAASAATYLACQLVSRAGIGVGLTVALLLSNLHEPLHWFQIVQLGDLPPLWPVLIVLAAAAMLMRRGPGGTLPLMVAGIVPLQIVVSMASLSAPNVLFGAAVLVTAVAARLFSPPAEVVAWTGADEATVQRDLFIGIGVNAGLAVLLIGGVHDLGFPAFGIGLLLTLTLLWDLFDDGQLHARGLQVPVRSLTAVFTAKPTLDKLSRASIPAGVRGLRTRSLLHVLGPYIPLEVVVADEHVERAQAVLADSDA
jgi:hypothetical protein